MGTPQNTICVVLPLLRSSCDMVYCPGKRAFFPCSFGVILSNFFLQTEGCITFVVVGSFYLKVKALIADIYFFFAHFWRLWQANVHSTNCQLQLEYCLCFENYETIFNKTTVINKRNDRLLRNFDTNQQNGICTNFISISSFLLNWYQRAFVSIRFLILYVFFLCLYFGLNTIFNINFSSFFIV